MSSLVALEAEMESSDRTDNPAAAWNAQQVRRPRQPTNLQTLLRFAMDATKGEDAPGGAEAGPMDEERRRFLEEALKSLTVDVPKVLQRGIRILTNTQLMNSVQLGQPVPDDIRAAFNNMLEFVDDIDVANDFQKLGGFAVFPICYGSENEGVRTRASELLAEVCQNNPQCQARVLEYGLLNVLLHLAAGERGPALAKCLLAISSAVREFPPGCRELVAQGGCGALAAALAQPHAPARARAAFLVRYLCQHYPDAKEQFIQLNIVKTIAEQLRAGRDGSSEHLLSILQTLLEGLDAAVVQQCRDPGLNLKRVLEEHLKLPELEGDDFIEEKEYCQAVLKVIDGLPRVELANNEVDR